MFRREGERQRRRQRFENVRQHPRGENAGQELTYYNVVRNMTPGGMWHGERLTLSLPVKGVFKDCCTACVALLQTGNVGPIIGATRWSEVQG